jgi:ATP-binding protein involved in chromosome partitioning
MPDSLTETQVRAALQQIKFPGLSRDIVSFGIVKAITVTPQNDISLLLEVSSRDPGAPALIQRDVESALRALPGVGQVKLQMNAVQPPPAPTAPSGMPNAVRLPGVKRVVAVASGKGGVGKSTVAVNLACALTDLGLKVGLMDADVYGPTVPKMLGAVDRPTVTNEKLDPVEKFGLRIMSMALLLDPGQAVIWRGPMIMKAIEQFAHMVNWGELDVLLVDLPPGTGDAQLSLVQMIALDGGVVVTTPQEVAMEVVRRGLVMFEKVNVRILGLVENMSYHVCPHCGKSDDIFGHGTVRQEAVRLNVPFLGEIPLNSVIREYGDRGEPVTLALPDSAAALAFRQCAAAVWGQLK